MSDMETYDFSMMRSEVTRLESALKAAIAADKQQAASFMLDFQIGAGSSPWPSTFNSQAEALVTRANEAMASIVSLCDGTLSANAPVPSQLEEDAAAWRARADAVGFKVDECAEQRDIPDWIGKAKNDYATAVLVQEAALVELQGVMTSTARSCEVGAQLNRAIFFAVAQATIEATKVVGSGSGGSGNWYYTRTANAVPTLESLVIQIGKACDGGVADGSADILAAEVRKTVAMPNLLVEGAWPTGTEGAGVEPAATDAGVSSDGSDADVDVESEVNQCLAGVNR